MMNISLNTNDNDKYFVLSEIKSAGGKGYYMCMLILKSGWLSCRRQFFFDEYYVEEFLKALKEMDKTLQGKALLKAEYEDQYLQIEATHFGQIEVKGELIEHSDIAQQVEFGFDTDQTCLKPLIADLERLLENKDW